MTQVLAKVSKSIKWSWTQWRGYLISNESVGLTFIYFFLYVRRWPHITPWDTCMHTPTFTRSHSPCLYSREAVKSQVLPFWCLFLQSSFTQSILLFILSNIQTGFHQNHPHPLHPSQDAAEVNVFNKFKENKWFLQSLHRATLCHNFVSLSICLLLLHWHLYF